MQSHALAGEERIGLVMAIVAHAALLGFIVWHPPMAAPVPPPERISVTLSDDVGLTSTSPEPNAAAAPDKAPMLGERQPAEQVVPPKPVVEAVPPPRPAPQVAPRPKPVPEVTVRPKPVHAQPDIIAELTRRAPAQRVITRPAGASRIGSDFLKGIPGAQADGASHNPPAAAIGPAVQSSLAGAISRQLRPHWAAPQGADAEKLVTLVRFRLGKDGNLIGSPEVVGQSGITPANEAQKRLHAEQAIRAVRLAAPFDLPPEYYSAWQVVTSRFDRRLSQ
jgi:hypothetical protein